MLRNKKVLLLISLLVAIGLWMYVMGNVDPSSTEKVGDISVEMKGTDYLNQQGLTATLNKPKMVTVTIEGKRSQVNKAKQKGIEAYVDVSSCDYGQNEGEIEIRMPEGVRGVTVEAISKETAKFTVK